VTVSLTAEGLRGDSWGSHGK